MARFESLWDCLYHWAAAAPDRTALRCGEQCLDYAALAGEAEKRAQWLLDQGVEPGDRVIIAGYNSLDWIIAYMGIMRLGAIAVPANNRLAPAQMADLATLLDARFALADARHKYQFVLSTVPLDILETWERPAAVSLPPLPAPDMPALISFTSGTTGLPKGAVLSTGGLFGASVTIHRYFGTGADDSTLILAPMFHNTGFVDQFGHMLLAGGETALIAEFHRKEALEAFRAAPATFVTAVPSVLRMLMLMDGADDIFGPARQVLFGGSPMPAAWSREMLERWPHLRLIHGYGLTEFGSACTFLPAEMITRHGESVGFPAPGVELRVVGEDGQDVTGGDVGEIWVAGPTRMIEYWRRPEATAEKISGKWLRTGDLGRFDEDKRLYLSGRRDDVINRGGEKIVPSHLESLLSDCAEVANCAVVGIPDPVLQQIPVAAIEVRAGHDFNPAKAQRHLEAHLPDYAVPRHYLVFERLPRIASGKIDRRATRDLIIARLEE